MLGNIPAFLPDITSVTLTSPQNINYSVAPNLTTTNFEAVTPGFGGIPAGNYIRTQDVTTIIANSGGGRYIVGGIPTTVAAADNTHNAATWTLAVVYSNPNMITSNLSLFIGAQQASNSLDPARAQGFCAPSEGPIQARLFASAIEGDYAKTGDQFLFGPTQTLTSADAVSGSNNALNNFFASQINTILPLTTDPGSGKLIPVASATLDTRGSYGLKNFPVSAPAPNNFGRQGFDITTVDISSRLPNNQTVAYSRGTTSDDDYTLIAIGMQIQVNSPLLVLDKKVDGVDSIYGTLGGQATYTLTVNNTGTATAFNPVLKDILEPGLSFVPGSFKVNNLETADPDLLNGYSFPNVLVGGSISFEFLVNIDAYPTQRSNFLNSFSVDYFSQPCANPPTQYSQSSQSNQPAINFLPLAMDDFGYTFEDTPLYGPTVLTNDIGSSIFVISYDPESVEGGTVEVNPDGTYVYIPAPGFVGEDSFTYTIQDAAGNQSTATVYILIEPNGAIGTDPVVNDDSATTLVNTPLNGPSVLENDFGLNLIVISWDQNTTQGGTVTVDPYGTYYYVPPLNFIGLDTFTYTVIDDFGHILTATVYITVLGEPPFGNNDTYTTLVNTPVSGNVLDNDSQTLTSIVSYTQPANGTVVFSDTQLGVFTYTPNPNFVGDDTFIYTAQDALGQTVTQTVIIHVLPITPIVANPDFNATNKNVPIVNGPTVLTNDTGINRVVITNGVVPTTQGGTAQVNPNGTYTYNPPLNFVGIDTFMYTIQDINGQTASTTVTIFVVDFVACQSDIQCIDGDNCTVGTCVQGMCSYSPVICQDGDQCQEGVCDLLTGLCEFEIRVGSPCNDAANCLINATCNIDGICVGADACVAPDTCSTSTCNGDGTCVVAGGCIPPTFCDGNEVGACIQCNDQIPCAGDLACVDNVCTGCVENDDCQAGGRCTIATCNDGSCQYSRSLAGECSSPDSGGGGGECSAGFIPPPVPVPVPVVPVVVEEPLAPMPVIDVSVNKAPSMKDEENSWTCTTTGSSWSMLMILFMLRVLVRRRS